jgi:alanine dehydrogenase
MPADAALLLLDRATVEPLLAPDDVIAAVREAFVLHSARAGRVFPVIREALPGGGVFGMKAGDVPSLSLLGFKAAGFWPANRARGAEPHQATIVLVDPATGRPQCVIDGNAITTARTGAAGALGLRALARRDSTSVAVFGTGVQARVQVSMARRVLPQLRHARYVAREGRRDAAFEAMFAHELAVEPATDADAAVTASDVVITATPGGGPLFRREAVRPGTHLNCVGADTRGKRELPDGLLAAARVVVDDHGQASSLGELQWAPDTPCVELGDVLTGAAPFERARDDITVCDLTGLALQDLTVARLVQQRAAARGLGHRLAWPW